MKQILQDLKTGETTLEDVPRPARGDGQLLISTSKSLVSVGTERMLLEFGKGNLLQKARQQPDKVKQVLDKIQTDGLISTLETVSNKLDKKIPLGYCNVGRVVESKSEGFSIGDRVVSNGHHAEIVAVPRNLCARIPDEVDDESAAFTVISAIALQGIRLIKPTLGETIVVTGLGLIGLMAVQLLRANGCRVIGIDYDSKRLRMAAEFGAKTIDLSKSGDAVSAAENLSGSSGVDAVLITASTDSNEPITNAAHMCRKRGRIVLVGVVGMQLSRSLFYEKELSFQVSCSYGPGRYDRQYEEEGRDYPAGYVRWTEQRNFEAVLDMMADGRLNVKPLISSKFSFNNAVEAYSALLDEDPIGILLDYPSATEAALTRSIPVSHGKISRRTANGVARLGFIGAGNYANSVLIPAFSATGAQLSSIASLSGTNAAQAARKYGFDEATSDISQLLARDNIDAIVIATRHNTHADLLLSALKAGKHVFVEKPIAINKDQLEEIEGYLARSNSAKGSPLIMAGFNRRYAPLARKTRALLETQSGPKSMIMTVNAGSIPEDHWINNPEVGGGRVIGECCHFVDFLRFLVNAPIKSASAHAMEGPNARDTININLKFSDGSLGAIHYFANGNRRFPKERLDIFSDGRILQLDNFKSLRGFGWPTFKRQYLLRQDKGQRDCAISFIEAINSGDDSALIPIEQLLEVSRVTLDVTQQLIDSP